MPAKKVNFEVVREIALALPGVEESTLHGEPSFKVSGRLLVCPALHKSAEPNSLMVRVSLDERARLLVEAPDAYYVTEHYLKHPAVLVRLARLHRDALRNLLATAWLFVSEKSATTGDDRPPAKRRTQRAKPRSKRRARS